MSSISRRAVLASLATLAGSQLLARAASATLVRGMALDELVGRSQHVVVGTPLSARCLYATFGAQRMIVTETQLRVDGVLGLQAPGEGELTVRTLGGQLAGVGELIHGQAELQRGRQCVGFFERQPDGTCWVTGMAQGHYPLDTAGAAPVLRASPQLPTIRDWEASAVKQLVGSRLSEAEHWIAGVRPR
jgi:hypothetical protein